MTTDRLQLTLIHDAPPDAQPLPLEVQAKGVELIAMMLVHLVREGQRGTGQAAEVRDECR